MNLNNRAIVEYKVVTKDPVYGTEVISWAVLRGVWCGIQDVLPSRDERVRGNIAMNSLRTRLRIRYCTDIDSSMRFIVMRPNEEIYNIIGGPAMLGNKQWLEFLIEQVSS